MISNIQYSISLHDINLEDKKIKRYIEDVLSDFHFSYWSVPVNAPRDVVRLVGQTKGGHSFLQFSDKLAHLTINFDDEYKNDIDKCRQYARQKLLALTDALENLKVRVVFNGVVAQYIYEDIGNPIERLKKKIMYVDTGTASLYGLGAHIAITHKDRYFINFELSSLFLPPHQKAALGVKVDVNDKYGVEKKGVSSAVGDIFKLAAIQEQINQDVIMKLLDEGKFELHE